MSEKVSEFKAKVSEFKAIVLGFTAKVSLYPTRNETIYENYQRDW